jgi:hypothetical protein
MLCREIIAVCFQTHTKHINTLCGRNVELLNVKTSGTCSNHWAVKGYVSVIKTSQLMLCREIIAVCSQIHTEHKYTVWPNVNLLNDKLSVHIVTTGL